MCAVLFITAMPLAWMVGFYRLLCTELRRRKGLAVKHAGVGQLLIQDDSVYGRYSRVEKLFPGVRFVIAGGAWSQAFGDQLGVHIPVEPQRGQIIHLGLADTDTSSWPIISAVRGHYMVPWPDGRVVVGATRETGIGF